MAINLDNLIDGALDGGDWRFAIELLLAHPRSVGLPESIATQLFAVAHELPGHEGRDPRKLALGADHVIRQMRRVA